MNNNEIFLEFWRSHQWLDPKPVIYRLYHDDQGRPLMYSTTEQVGKCIEITAEQYAMADINVRVRDGRIHPIPRPLPPRLVPHRDIGVCCEIEDVCVITTPDRPHQKWSLVQHAQD